MSATRDAPCRLFVFLARQSPVAVVLRRGPSDWVRLTRWDTSTDRLEHGQWMRARVYERRSDISPDGSLFVAFVRGTPDEPMPNHDTWVAVSRPPWFSALALWFVGGTYCVGGYFPGPNRLWLGFDPDHLDLGTLPRWFTAETNVGGYTDRTNDWPDRTVWFNRLMRDGWARVPDAIPEAWRRTQPGGSLVLTMTLRSTLSFHVYGGRFELDYHLTDRHGAIRDIGPATWADWNRQGRLIVARNGTLLHWTSTGEPRVIADFNDQAPDPQPAPAEALTWPSPGPS